MFQGHIYDLLEKVYDIDSLLYNNRQAIVARIGFVQNHERQMREAVQI